jgi:hypothetical protein
MRHFPQGGFHAGMARQWQQRFDKQSLVLLLYQ